MKEHTFRAVVSHQRLTTACMHGEHNGCTHVINLGEGVRGIRLCDCFCHGPKYNNEQWARKVEQLLTGQEP